jgi:outer membrane receptor protein involved in Fe transport
MKDYLLTESSTRGESELNDVTAWLSGTVAELPAGPLSVAVGAEYRTFSGFRDYDPTINDALATGNQISDVDNNESKTKEAYVETVVPVVKDMTLVHSLDVEGAFRASDTDGLGNYNTWKYGLVWAPIEDVRLRVMKARAVRVPIPGELSGIGQTFGVVTDPCAEAFRTANPTRVANCATDGVPVGYVPGQIISQSVAGLTGGNPNLSEEESDTLTYGVVWTPSFVENLTVTVDRFEIDIQDAIAAVARQNAVNLCYDTVARQFCSAITRGTSPLLPGATYVLTAANEVLQNINEYNIKGTDISVNYLFSFDSFGAFNANLNWTVYDQADQVQIGGNVLDLKGLAGGDTVDQGYIENQAVLNLGWRLDAFSANWNMRYVGPAEMGFGTEEAGFPQLDSVVYHNVNVAWDFSEKSKVYIGANNLFDTDPPFMASGSSGTQALDTVPGYYDVYGLYAYAGIVFRM